MTPDELAAIERRVNDARSFVVSRGALHQIVADAHCLLAEVRRLREEREQIEETIAIAHLFVTPGADLVSRIRELRNGAMIRPTYCATNAKCTFPDCACKSLRAEAERAKERT